MPGCRSKAIVHIYLPEVFGCHMHRVMAFNFVDACFNSLTRHLKITLRDSVRGTVCVIGCRYKYIEVFGKAQSPRIVGSIAKELQLLSIGSKMIQSLAKAHRVFTVTHHSFKA